MKVGSLYARSKVSVLRMQKSILSLINIFLVSADFPVPSIHPERAHWFFDDTCDIEEPFEQSPVKGCRQCHCTETVNISCIDALKEHVGSVETSFLFTRLPWDQALADRIRTASDPPRTLHPNSADQKLVLERFQDTRVEYKYFATTSCELNECCIGGRGWRRLLMFDATDQNIGGQTLLLGKVFTVLDDDTQQPTALYDRGLYEYDVCHRHYHFRYYGTFTYGDEKFQNAKRGFCILSVGRQANAEWSPMWSPFYTCTNQGITPGWTGSYTRTIRRRRHDLSH